MYKRIKISFINAGSITINEGDWDDYDLVDGFIVIKKNQAWIAMYNAKEVFSVVLEKDEEIVATDNGKELFKIKK